MFIRILAAVAFVIMVIVNGLANALPINGIATGAVSDSYPNLFAPAGVTFSIWGVIYFLLGMYTTYQLGWFARASSIKHRKLVDRVSTLFLITSLINSTWIFAWHYRLIGITVLLMLGLLVTLIKIADTLRPAVLSGWEKFVIATPFSIYFGWITVATIANITTWLVSIGWNGFGLPELFWLLLILVIGAAIGIGRLLYDKRISYGLVLIWAYAGIYLKHVSPDGFNGQYPAALITLGFLIAAFAASVLTAMVELKKQGKSLVS